MEMNMSVLVSHNKFLRTENNELKDANYVLIETVKSLETRIRKITSDHMVKAGHCLFVKLENGKFSRQPYCPRCFIPLQGSDKCSCGFTITNTILEESVELLDGGYYTKILT